MSTYEEKLNEFADGKQLIRLSHPVRDRADALCDACSSIQPRILYPLKDQDSGRYYFVGTTCLEELAKRGAILRRFCRDSGLAAYDSEMERRSQELKETGTPHTNGTGNTSTIPESPQSDADAESGFASGDSHLFPTVFIFETTEHCEAWVYILTPQGTVNAWGHSKECRYQEAWQMGGEKGMLLEKVKQARPEALGQSITKAWEEARSRLQDSPLPPSLLTEALEAIQWQTSLGEHLNLFGVRSNGLRR